MEGEKATGPNILEKAALAIACVACAALTILSLLDLLYRSIGQQFYLASEGNGFLMGWLIFFALPFVTRTRSHITIEVVLNSVSAPLRAKMQIFNHIVSFFFIAILIVLCGKITYVSWADSLRSQGILRIPTFYPFLGIMIGFVLMLASQFLALLEAIRDLRTITGAGNPEEDQQS